MSALLLEQTSPGASSAIVVGRAEAGVSLKNGYKSVLWFVDAEGTQAAPAGVDREALVPVVLEQTDVSALEPLLETFALKDARALPDIFVTSDVTGRFSEAYEIVVGAMHDVFEILRRARLTRQEEGFLWQKHFLLNLPDFVRRRIPAEWENALAGIPAIVCGAGPSLDVSAPVLARAAPDAIVFAADSALRTLARHGVPADFAISVDAAKAPDKCIPDDCAPARVVLSAISPPAWRDFEADFRLHYVSCNSLTGQLLASFGVAPAPVKVAENCGITAFELARFMGCAPIHLFGMDLAADAADPVRRHAADSDPTIARGAGFATQQEMPLVPGNYVEGVPTFLYGELRAFNKRLGELPPGLVVNVNDRGARLASATLVHPGSFDLPARAEAKRRRLWQLAAPSVTDAEGVRAAFAEIGAQGAHGCREAAELRAHLSDGRAAEALAQLRRLFSNETFGRAMGSFALKIMPHLAAGMNDDGEFYAGLVDELEELCCLAEGLYEFKLEV
ncbi:MAG: 6-hydroxymethylpterin diphosphokinase MptE-like protein [Opitutaceae bacterium]